MSDDESEFDAYLSLADVTEDDHRWAFGTGFADPLAGLGEAVPPDVDPAALAERGHYDFGPVDWDEFTAVVKGNGPCNAQRIACRQAAHDDGAWVREAAAAHAAKHGARGKAA